MAVSRIDEAGLNINQYGNRNVIINGAMMLSQRQTSSSNVGNQYVLDRFKVYKQNTGSTYTCSQASVTDLAGFNNSLKMECTTADTSLAANEEGYIQYKMEGQDLQGFEKGFSSAKGFALSFYVKTNKTGLYTVRLFDRDNTRAVSGSYTVSNTDWNRYTVLFPADTTGKFDNDSASTLELFFKLFAGSDTNTGTLQTTWAASADANSATGQVNFADSTSNVWEVTGVQLEVGDTATDFEHRTFGDVLAQCQRYYYQHSNTGNATRLLPGSAISYNTGFIMLSVQFPVHMRGTPALVETTGTNYLRYFHTASNTNLDGFGSIQEASVVGANVYNSSGISGLTAGNVGWVRMVDALYDLAFDAEL